MKVVYRVLIAFSIYIGSVLFFTGSMEKGGSIEDAKLTDMSSASLPVISIRIDEKEINRIHGYCSATDEMLIRESMTPLDDDKSMEIVIDEGGYTIKKMNYEVLDADTAKLQEEGVVIAFDKQEDAKTARLTIKNELEENKEYLLKITLISNESKRIYYYTRILMIPDSNFIEKLAFVEGLHDDLFTKNTGNNFKKYLEYKPGTDNTSFAKLDIYSSEDILSFGSLSPVMIYKELPMITEYTKDTASVTQSYYVSVETEYGSEIYHVKDAYRFGYTSIRVYLYNFERKMEVVFNPEHVSTAANELKIGITSEIDIQFYANSSSQLMAFVRGRELWLYDGIGSVMKKVFSFREEETDYIRDTYDQHDIKIMNMDEMGNITFMVYGYMNRGEYEGRVGILIYEYNKESASITEKTYIPFNTTYQILKEEVGELAYYNAYDTVYFMFFDTLYSYNFVSEILTIHAENLSKDAFLYNRQKGYAIYQDKNEKAEQITVLMLDTGITSTIDAQEGCYIGLLTTVEDYFIYGLIRKEDITVTSLGDILAPMYRVNLAASDGTIIKSSEKPGYYVLSASAEENKVTLNRMKKSDEVYQGYVKTVDDSLLSAEKEEIDTFKVSVRVTDRMLKEYYISFPSGSIVPAKVETAAVQNQVISEDTTLRAAKPQEMIQKKYAYSFGELIFSSSRPGLVAAAADEAAGTVMDGSGRVLWQRGVQSSKHEISGILPVYTGAGLDSLQAVLKMLYTYQGLEIDTSRISRKEKSIPEWMEQHMKLEALDLTGAGLTEVLYMVYRNKPVIAMKDDYNPVLITAYDANGVVFIDPAGKRIERMALSEAEKLFSDAGNVFISYLE